MHGLLGRALALLLIFAMVLTTSSINVFAEEQTPQQQLETLLDEIYALNSEDYTEDSWNALKEQADSVNRPVTPYDEATGEGMPDWVANLMITNLTNLKNSLVKNDTIADTTPQQQLETLLDEIYALNSEDYTEDSWNALKEQADSVNRPVTPYDEATEEGMPDWVANLMITNLTKLKDALVPVGSQKTVYEQLEEKLQEAEALDSSKYTEETWTQVKEIIDSVDRPVSSENITEKLASKLIADLDKAVAQLEEKPANDIVLEDGTYIAWLDTSAINYLLLPRAKIVAKNGKYNVTLYSVGAVSDTFDGDMYSNVRYRVYSRDDYQYDMVEVVKPEFNGEFEKGSEYFSNKNLVEGFDLASSSYKDSVKSLVSADNDEMFFDSVYTSIDGGGVATTFETSSLDDPFFVNGLISYTKHTADGGVDGINSYSKYGTFSFQEDSIVKVSENFDGMAGSYVVDESSNDADIRRLDRTGESTVEVKNGKVYATFPVNANGVVSNVTGGQSGVLCDENGNALEVNNGKVTFEYNSLDDVIIGKHIAVNVSVVDSYRGVYNKMAYITLATDFRANPVVLIDSTTGIKLYTSTHYVSENAKLTASIIKDSGSTDTKKDAWAFKESKLPKYNKELYFNLKVTDNGQETTDFGGEARVYVPKIEGLNSNAIRMFLAAWDNGFETYAFGWFNENIQPEDNGYSILLDRDYFNGNWCIYDEMMSTTDGSGLADGTYRVPITTFNEAQPTQTSMSAQCLGDYATLVVKNGVKRLELEFNPVNISELDGYVIQMWNKESDGTYKELTYTSYYKNDDGSYFTDELNEGTNNYYPKTAYMILPTDDVQFITKFRVSAMDAIMGDNGDATRDAIFTIYYDQAEKISDETPDPADEEIPGFEPADMTKLNELIAKAEQIDKDKYTASTYLIMSNALSSAKTVLQNSKATQDEVDSAAKELEDAINGLKEKASDIGDLYKLPNGVYSVYGQMVKVDKETFSMSNNAINHTIKLTAKDGKYYITMNFNGLTVGQKMGYLSQLKYFTTGYTVDKYGNPQGTLGDVTVDSYQKNSDGSLVSDQYGTNYPDEVTFELIPEALNDGYVPLQVFVPIMDAISEGTGTQPVFLKLDWSTIKQTTDDDPSFDNNDNDNNNNDNGGNGNNGTTGTLPTSTLSTTGGSKLSSSSLSGTTGSSLKSASSVKTGDIEQNYVLYISIALLGAVLAMAGVMSYKKKRN